MSGDQADLEAHLETLEQEEREVSALRMKLHERLASFPNELVAQQERELSARRRSLGWALGCWVLLSAMVPLSRVPSAGVTFGSGLFIGGVLGNLISAGTDHLVVPNPFFFTTDNGAFAFNLADASILVGNVILMV